jgi:tripartite ATP-independent transporter DctP family solute receptor
VLFRSPFIISQENLEKAYSIADGNLMQEPNNGMEKKGFKVLGYYQLGFRNVTNSKRPIEKPADLAGVKIRLQPNELHMQTFRMLGANPTAMDWAEVFSALQQRVIDGQENPLDIIYTNKFYEVQKFLSLTGHFFDFAGFWMNKKYFDQLPADLQKVVSEAAIESIKYQRNLSNETTNDYLQKLRGVMQVNEIKPQNLKEFQEKVGSIYKDYLSKTSDKAFAEKILNTLGVKY